MPWRERLVEAAPDLVCLCRRQRLVYMNKAGRRMLGATARKPVEGRFFADFVHPDDRRAAELLLAGKLNGAVTVQFRLAGARGRSILMKAVGHGFRDRDGPAIAIWARAATPPRSTGGAGLKRMLDAVSDGIVTVNGDGIVLGFNAAAERIFGYAAAEVLGSDVRTVVPAEGGDLLADFLRQPMARRGRFRSVAAAGRRKDGTRFPVELGLSELVSGEQPLITIVARDPAARRSAADALGLAGVSKGGRKNGAVDPATANLRLVATVIESANDAIVIADRDFRVASVNPAFTEITGYAGKEAVGKRPHFYAELQKDSFQFSRMNAALKKRGHWEGELWSIRKDGAEVAMRMAISAVTGHGGAISQYAILISDITKRKKDEERIRYQANFDGLTGLPNRTLFLDRLTQNLTQMARAHKKLGLMFIDLDGFKLVNDTLGHDMGDLLLQESAKRLQTCVRDGDTLARLGGDEFTVIMPDLKDARDAIIVAQRILDALAKAYMLDGNEAFVSASIGITIFPDDARDAKDLLRNADAAMYRAKDRGKANYQFFTADLNEEVRLRMVLKNNLIKARERDEFRLHYQPKVDLRTGLIIGVEAFMRWSSADVGAVPPDRFVPVLEEAGMMMDVGAWVIRTACERHAAWLAAGLPPVRVAVNLSARQLREPSFVALVRDILKRSEMRPEYLEIEITEIMLMSGATPSHAALANLHEMGVRIAMDDFGTGYSSLALLKRFPIDTIKIDRTFVAGIDRDPGEAEIVKAIITMSQSLRRRVAAEGVETKRQLELLKSYGCDEYQGFLFCPPGDGDAITDFLRCHDLARI